MARKNYLDKEGLLYYNEKLKSILNTKADSADVNNKISTLNTKIETTKTELTGNLDAYKSTTDNSINNILAKDNSQDTEIDNLKAKDTSHDTEIADLKAKDTSHDNSIANLVAKDTELDTDITNLQTRDNQHDAQISNLTEVKANKVDVTKEISDAIKGVTQFNYEIVDDLPETGVKGTIYLMLYSQSHEGDVYQEFIWVESTSSYESLGFTNEIDLSNYVTFDDTISNSEIDDMFVVRKYIMAKYLQSKNAVGDYNLGIANENFTYNPDLFTYDSDNKMYFPKVENFTLKLISGDRETYLDWCFYEGDNEHVMFFEANEEAYSIISDNGMTFVGLTFEMNIPAGALIIDGINSEPRVINFVYGEEIDGSTYPQE